MIFKTKVLLQFHQKSGGGPPDSYGPARALSLVQSCSMESFQIPDHWMHNSPIFNVLRRTILNLFLIIILSCTYKPTKVQIMFNLICIKNLKWLSVVTYQIFV